jgi:hypothetical protein
VDVNYKPQTENKIPRLAKLDTMRNHGYWNLPAGFIQKKNVLKPIIKGIEENITFHVESDKGIRLLIFIMLSNSE